MIFSIGHGNKEISEFLNELNKYKIEYLIDIRSKPYSKYSTQYNKESLKLLLSDAQIKYVYLGEYLGGLPSDKSCYIDGKVDYDIIKDKVFFKKGLQRLINANHKKINIAVMCSESKPEDCHRTKLIGQELLKKNINTTHIISIDKTISQIEVMNKLTKGNGFIDLFGNETGFTSRKKYNK